MAELKQYLRVEINGTAFLLPSSASAAIEQRDALVINQADGNVTAWRKQRGGRQPVYALDAAMQVTRRDDWQRAVFLDESDGGTGLVVDDVELLGRDKVTVNPYTPVGPAPTAFGHLYSGAWIEGRNATLVFDARVLSAYLHSLGDPS